MSEINFARPQSSARIPYGQIVFWIIAMASVGVFQYGWTLSVGPIGVKHHWDRAAIQVAFSILLGVEAVSTILTGHFIDRFGIKRLLIVSGALIALGGCLNATADYLAQLYMGCGMVGVGVGFISCAAPNGAIRWFPNHRGAATGTVVTGFVLGSMFGVLGLYYLIQWLGYEISFLIVGLVTGAILVVLSRYLRMPNTNEVLEPAVAKKTNDVTPREAVLSGKAGPFWILYAIFVLVGSGGLMMTAQFALIAADLKVANVPVMMPILGITMAALPLAMTFDRVTNAVCRPFFGTLSDYIGRENAMALAFSLEAVGVIALTKYGHDPLMFVLLTGLIFFGWGEIFSLIPTTLADTYGTKHATTIYGYLYSAKGVASFFAPLANVLMAATGSWSLVFWVMAAAEMTAVVLVLFVLKPMRKRLTASA